MLTIVLYILLIAAAFCFGYAAGSPALFAGALCFGVFLVILINTKKGEL